MGLNYLQKKNWHPGSIKNQEIVWIREQLQAEIIKREQERAKKLAEEKNIEELKRIQVEAGLIPKSHLDRMEWMYDVGRLEQQQKTTEEYLLGKPITPEEAEKLAQQRDKKNGIQPQYQTIFKEETTNAKCEDFVKVHEDPLFKIMQGEMQIKQQFYENPLKMKQILEDDCKNKANKKSKKKDKKEKKEKKSKKHKKNSSRSRSRSSDVNTSSTSLYNSYIQQRLGGIATKDQDGNIKADFGMMKKKYRNNLSKDADVDELRKQMEVEGQNRIKQQANQQFDTQEPQVTGQFLNQIRKEIYNQNDSQAKYDRIQRNRNHHEKHRD